jgi:hypothetical protein
MKLQSPFCFAALAGVAHLLVNTLCGQDHGHLNLGALGVTQDAPLFFQNGADFAEPSGYVKSLVFTNAGRFSGYYHGNISLTVLPATPAYAGPDPDAPALGSFIQFRMDCLDAPKGGTFGFWDAGTTEPSLLLERGQTSTNLWLLTETDGAPGADPYGHIHGRRFPGTRPGLYKIQFTAVDTSLNGSSGGPIHTSSPPLAIWFAAGVTMRPIAIEGGRALLRFSTESGANWQLESSTELGPTAEWRPVSDSVPGDDHFHAIQDEIPIVGNRFYRMRQIP